MVKSLFAIEPITYVTMPEERNLANFQNGQQLNTILLVIRSVSWGQVIVILLHSFCSLKIMITLT